MVHVNIDTKRPVSTSLVTDADLNVDRTYAYTLGITHCDVTKTNGSTDMSLDKLSDKICAQDIAGGFLAGDVRI